jgi:molecular chaperone HscB
MSDVTHFERLGLPRRFRLDAAEMERNYLRRSREVHPDFYQLSAGAERRASTELSALLNDAYATLRDPFRRAEYLLQLEGGPTAAEAKATAPEFLEEMLDLRMQIAEAQAERDPHSETLANLELKLAQRRDGLMTEVAAAFERLEGLPAGVPERKGLLLKVRQLLNATKFIQGLLRDLQAE